MTTATQSDIRGFRGFADRAAHADYERKLAAEEAVAEALGIAERERVRQRAADLRNKPSLDQIERRHGRAARDRAAALNLPQHRADFAQAAE